MGQITRDCPHCGTKKVAFTSYAEAKKTSTNVWVTAFRCGGCSGGIIAEIETGVREQPHGYDGNVEAFPHFRVLKTYPEAKAARAPQHLPENLTSFFLQAANGLQSGTYDASAMMARKTLEVAVKALDPEGTGTLYNRIEKMAEKGLITPDIREWAHIIRDDGNTAAHEEHPIEKKFAEELLAFAEIFLTYTFTLPGMIAEKRGKV